MAHCDMQVPNRGRDPWTWRQCKRQGRYILTDRYNERWVFCKQHFDAYQAAMG